MSFRLAAWLFIFCTFGLLTGCQGPAAAELNPIALANPPVASELDLEPAAAVTVRATISPTPPPPIINIQEPSPTAPAGFALPSEGDLATSTPLPTVTPLPTIAPTDIPEATPTLPPTFTPPSLPGTSPNDHYWLRRPIAEGGTVWTDKSYPYGSTRGGTLRPHHGVEFNVTMGTPVYASASGMVVVAGDDLATAFGPQTNFYGNLVVIQHETAYQGQAVYTLYGHLSELAVQVGQRVESQQFIGRSGSSGIADGPHLHFEVRIGRNNYASTRNPLLWLYPFSEHGTVAGRVLTQNGGLIEEVLVTATRIDARSTYKGTTTYGGTTVNADRGRSENFVLDDVKAGYYLIQTQIGDRRFKQEAWVYPLQTTFVEFVTDIAGESPPGQ